METVVAKCLSTRCLNGLSKIYLTYVVSKSLSLIKIKEEEFKLKWRSFYENKFAFNDGMYPKVRGSWYKEAEPKREYNILENYRISTP